MDALEILGCAKINFENFAKMNPHLPIQQHPIWILAMDQLTEGINKLKEEMRFSATSGSRRSRAT